MKKIIITTIISLFTPIIVFAAISTIPLGRDSSYPAEFLLGSSTGDSLNIGNTVPLQFNGFGTGYTRFQISTSSNDIEQSNFINRSSGTSAAVCHFLDNDKTILNGVGANSAYYSGICMASSGYNLPGFNAIRPNGLAVFATDGPVTLGSGSTNSASSSIYFQAGSGLDASYDAVLAGGSGYFGIGTTNPKDRLWVTATGTHDQIGIEDSSALTNQKYATIGYSRGRLTINTMSDAQATTTRLTVLQSNGNVGIGTTSPPQTLTVANGQLFTFFNSNTNYAGYFYNGGGNGMGLEVSAGSAGNAGATILSLEDLNGKPVFTVTGNGAASTTGSLQFGTYNQRYAVIEGDSLSTSAKWPLYLASSSPYFKAATQVNYAVSGETTDQMVAEYATEAHTSRPLNKGDDYWFFVMGGINDVGVQTASYVYANLKTLWANARSDGYKVVAFTLMKSNNISADANNTRNALNGLILSDPSLYDYVVQPDYVLNPDWNFYYFADNTHPNASGNQIFSDVIEKTINARRAYDLVPANGTTTSPTSFNMILNPTGNVAIGTTTPNRRLWVSATGTTEQILLEDTNAPSGLHYLTEGYSGGVFTINKVTDTQATTTLFTIDANKTHINLFPNGSSGRVSVGTTAPVSQIESVCSNTNTSLNSFDTCGLVLTNNNVTTGNYETLAFRGVNTSGNEFTAARLSGVNVSNAAAAETGALAFVFTNAGTLTEKARMIADGSLGIGTTTPSSYLSINQAVAGSGNPFITLYESSNNGTNGMGIDWIFAKGLLNAGNVNARIEAQRQAATVNVDQVFYTGNATLNEVMRLRGANQAVGIGTSTPYFQVTIYKSGSTAANSPQLVFSASTTVSANNTNAVNNWAIGENNANGNKFEIASSSVIGTNPRFTIDGSGQVGIGTTSPFATLAVNPTAGNASNQFVVGSSTATNLKLDNSGHLFLPNITSVTGGTNRPACYVAATGELVDDTTSVCQVSSERFKHDIVPLTVNALDIIKNLTPVSYSPNDDALYDYKNKQYGLVAEQVASIDPHLAEYGQDGLPRTLDDRALLSTSIKAIQELQKEVESLKEEIRSLKNNNK